MPEHILILASNIQYTVNSGEDLAAQTAARFQTGLALLRLSVTSNLAKTQR